MAALVNAKLKKGEPKSFKRDETELAVMEGLREKLTTPSILALPKREEKFIIDTKACDSQEGCVLQEEKNDSFLKSIGYRSRILNDAEQRYNTTHRECFGSIVGNTVIAILY